MSLGDMLSLYIGIERSVSLVASVLLSAVLLCFLVKGGLLSEYGLCRPKTHCKEMLFYLPLLLIMPANLFCGVGMSSSLPKTLIYVGCMMCVGFLEELIFRGLLFNAMRKDSERAAVVVSSLTFGMGHIINLFNGSGADLLQNLLQVIYACAAGFMFVMIYLRCESLVPCIIGHGVFNSLSAFSGEALQKPEMEIISAVYLTVVSGLYALYLALSAKGRSKET